MPKEIANKTEKETYIKCKKCGAISVDGSKELVRVIGKEADYE